LGKLEELLVLLLLVWLLLVLLRGAGIGEGR